MSAKVIFTNSFTYDWHIGAEDLLAYYARPSAFTNKAAEDKKKDKDLLSYMGNAEKSDGCFNDKTDLFTQTDIDEHRKLEQQSKANGCPKYVSVISFQNDFLEENNLLVNGVANITALKQLTRKAVNTLIRNEKKFDEDNIYWAGAIHTNTDNIHIHLSILERERREDRVKKYRDGDMISVDAMDKMKSSIISSIIKDNPKVIELTRIERELLLPKLSESYTNATAQMYDLIGKLPKDKGWQYNRPKMKKYQPDIDKVVMNVVNSNEHLKSVYDSYEKSIDDLCDYFKEIYGAGRTHKFVKYKDSKLNEFRERAGNALLRELSKMDTDNSDYIQSDIEQASEDRHIAQREQAAEDANLSEEENMVDEAAEDSVPVKMEWSSDYKLAVADL